MNFDVALTLDINAALESRGIEFLVGSQPIECYTILEFHSFCVKNF